MAANNPTFPSPYHQFTIQLEPWPWEMKPRRKTRYKGPAALCPCGRPRNITNRLCSRCYMRQYRAKKAG